MKMRMGEKSLILFTSAVVVVSIAVVYVKHFLLEHKYETCRFYADAILDIDDICTESCSEAIMSFAKEALDVPPDFSIRYLKGFTDPNKAQLYFEAYHHCMVTRYPALKLQGQSFLYPATTMEPVYLIRRSFLSRTRFQGCCISPSNKTYCLYKKGEAQ